MTTIPQTLRTDDRSRTVLTGHPNEMFIVHENEDGSVLLEPAEVVSRMQRAYDSDPELRETLAAAAAAPKVTHTRHPR